jgi:uncharacterized protein YjiS (DUF1127 family)
MGAILSAIVLPAVTNGPSVVLRLISAVREGMAGYLGRRTAIASLHSLDDRALRDIGLDRFQIEAAAYGLIRLSSLADDGMMTLATAADLCERQRAPTVEVVPWS